ncbi:uncharacterized protein LOC9654007 [Selaginella moellendorffii]|uniref:uncharacterized protein LOC9654007 n=1 Tax=Selaginella moellendorffii TaxID=88036 RepID=UPI000D1D0A32|nr:uncharacterized protein LOC9654007 [Selaginella moellendorffii]|eukprot:XP_024543790.1 uncharacterized protein LOC9654007 [Selaginella moellendorffii]
MDDYYIELLKSHLLPPLGTMMRNADLSVTERGKAIKNLADGSLAITGSGAGWSAALGDQLQQQDPPAAAAAAAAGSNLSSSGRRFPALLRVARSSKRKICRRLRHRSILKAAARQVRASRCQGRLKRRIMQSQQQRRSSRDDEQTIQSRVKALQGLVPGGHDMNCSVLLGEAADYMMFLRFQVGVLQSVAAAIESQQQPRAN